jgi:hypothetical protein
MLRLNIAIVNTIGELNTLQQVLHLLLQRRVNASPQRSEREAYLISRTNITGFDNCIGVGSTSHHARARAPRWRGIRWGIEDWLLAIFAISATFDFFGIHGVAPGI